jgi:hypothetical protein
MLKKIISIALSAIAVSCIVGCSNQSPVSISENNNAPVKDAAFYSGEMQDISGYGTDVWAVHRTDNAYSNGDYYLYYYRTNTSSWEKTSHWGKRVAVTSYGKCYHFNSYNAIWCCKMKSSGDSSGYVADGPSGTIIDIAAGKNSSNAETIWILMATGAVYRAAVTNGTMGGWVFGGTTDLVGDKLAIATDPSNAGTNAIMATSQGVAKFRVSTPTDYWEMVYRTSPVGDVALYGQYRFFYIGGDFLYKQYQNNTPVEIAGDNGWSGLSADNSKVMYLGRGEGMPGYIYY